MKKILIIDNDAMLMKLLAKKISNTLGFEVDTLASADVSGVDSGEYLLCFAEPSLAGANGELLDALIAQKLCVVALSANGEKAFRAECLKKDILAFLHKENPLCVEQMLALISSISEHSGEKVILAMSKLNERNELKKVLNLRGFKVLGAAHGEEALNYLEDNADTRLIICDAIMPVIDAKGLMDEVKESYPRAKIDFIVLGEKDDSAEAEFLSLNVGEFITKPVSKELLNARLDKFFRAKDEQKLLQIFSDFEPKTGAKNNLALKNDFDDYLKELANGEEFAFAVLEIDDLQGFKDEYGEGVGVELVKTAVRAALDECQGRDIVGHISFERICIVLKRRNQEACVKILSTIRERIKARSVLVSLDELYFSVCIGATFGKSGASFNELLKKAENALKLAHTAGKDRVELCF